MRAFRGPGVVVLAGLLAACGGGSSSGRTSAAAALPSALGRNLAAQADAVAAALERGDECGAYRLGQALVQNVSAARQAGQVPARLDAALTRSVGSLAARLQCPPPAATTTTEPGPPAIPPGQAKKQGHPKKKHNPGDNGNQDQG
jgi:hypothetical protein